MASHQASQQGFPIAYSHNPTLMASPSSFSSNTQQSLFAACMGMGAHNLTRVHHAHHDHHCPYPLRVEVYTWPNMAKCEDVFKELFLDNFILAQKWVAHWCLDRLELRKNWRALLARGVACMMDVDDDQNGIWGLCGICGCHWGDGHWWDGWSQWKGRFILLNILLSNVNKMNYSLTGLTQPSAIIARSWRT